MTLRFEQVTARYGGRQIFRAVSFDLVAGDVLGLIGTNGAGKTTMLRVAAGLIRPARGHVTRTGPVMYFGGEATLPGGCRADRWTALFGAPKRETRLLRRLSRGTRQIEGLSALLHERDWTVGLLDEPWEGLDPNGARWLADELGRHRSRGASLLVSSHRLHDIAEVCTAFALLANEELRMVRAEDVQTSGAIRAADLASLFDKGDRG